MTQEKIAGTMSDDHVSRLANAKQVLLVEFRPLPHAGEGRHLCANLLSSMWRMCRETIRSVHACRF